MCRFTGTCPEGTVPRDSTDMHDCSEDDGGCSAENCCHHTCAAAGVTCPGDQILKDDGLQTCREDCEDHTPGTQTDCGDFCGPQECCEDIYSAQGPDLVAYCEGEGNCASALTDTGYQFTYDQFTDSSCTQSAGVFGAAPVSGTTATCVSTTYDSGGEDETPLGFFAYCTADGRAISEYVASAERCPPGSGGGGALTPLTATQLCCFTTVACVCHFLSRHHHFMLVWSVLCCMAALMIGNQFMICRCSVCRNARRMRLR